MSGPNSSPDGPPGENLMTNQASTLQEKWFQRGSSDDNIC